MKKYLKILALVLVVASMLTIGAAAAPGDGLGAFEDVADMTTYTFSDVNSNRWSYRNIKVSYDKGILVGFPDGTFKPTQNVTWAQAITIAARMHSVYYGNALNMETQKGDQWYSPYYRYCSAHKLLPSSCPKVSALGNTNIQRYDIAYIFSRTIDAEDLPAICDLSISDNAKIPSYYLSSVKKMYAAGVLTGFEDRSFRGSTYATREQIAAVISRLVQPAERLGHDSKANQDMAAIESNLENDSVFVQIGSKYYCIYKYYETTTTERYALYLTDGNDLCKQIYTCAVGDYINNISLYNGKIYFCESTFGTANGKLWCYDPNSGKFSTVYEGRCVEAYCFYNGGLYALTYNVYSDKIEEYSYSFGQIANGGFKALLPEMSYYEACCFQPYGWNGGIYFKLSAKDGPTNLYCYNIATQEVEKVADFNINTSFFDGHVMYFLAYDADGNYDRNLYAISIQTPGAVKTVGEFPAPTNSRYRTLYKNGDKFYCLSSFNRNVYSMDAYGSSRMALICGGVYNSLCFSADKMVMIPNTLITSNVNEMKVYNAKSLSARALYGDWIGLSCYYQGARFVPEEGKSVYTSEESVSTVSNLSITVPEAFSRGDDFIVRAKYTNNTGSDIRLRSYIVKVYLNNELVAYDINRMVGMDMKNYDIQTFTFVIADTDVFRNFDVSDGRVSVEIIPTFDVIVNEAEQQSA